MTAPVGLGSWIAFGHGGLPDRCAEIGAAWIAPRAGFDGWNDSALTVHDKSGAIDVAASARKIEPYRAVAPVFPWIYPTMTGWRRALDGFAALWATGLCAGLLVDAEAEWCGPDAARNKTEAREFVRRLRDGCPGAWIGHAPVDYIDYHPTFPWAEFGALDASMPQVYAWEHNDLGHAYHLKKVDEEWRLWEIEERVAGRRVAPRWPIGCTYRPKQRGYDRVTGRPIPLPPLEGQGARVAADVAAFLDHPWTKSVIAGGGAPSLYSLEAAPPEVIELLATRARIGTLHSPPLPETLPAPPDVGFTEAGRPGFAYSGPILDDRGTRFDRGAATPLRAGDGGDDHAPAPLDDDDLDVTKP